MSSRRYSPLDRALSQADRTLATLFGNPRHAARQPRPSPADALDDTSNQQRLSAEQRRSSARLMRVNHTGEVCAQALYQGQALTARSTEVREAMVAAGAEEADHLRWCRQRIDELGGRRSLLDPLFYLGSLSLGAAAGLAGDRWSLGFLAETERQVERHLDDHIQRLPAQDHKSRALLDAMRDDEARHAASAEARGGGPLPAPLRGLMALSSKLMTRSTYWL